VPVWPPPRNGKRHASKRCRQCRYPRPAGTAQRRCRRPIPRRSRPGGDGPGSTGCGPAATAGRSSGHRSQIHASTTAIYPPEWAGARPVPGNSLRRQSSVASDRFRNPQRPFSLGAGTALHAPNQSSANYRHRPSRVEKRSSAIHGQRLNWSRKRLLAESVNVHWRRVGVRSISASSGCSGWRQSPGR
jgi:hypothetical protein